MSRSKSTSHTAFSRSPARPSVPRPDASGHMPGRSAAHCASVPETTSGSCRSLSPEERDEYAKTLAPREQSAKGARHQRSQNRQRARLKTMEERKAVTSLQGSPDALSDLITTTEE